jgi:hypothetical protein
VRGRTRLSTVVRLQTGRARVLKEFDTVRVVRLDQTHREFQGSDGFCRAPRIGDVGAICHEYEPGNPHAPVAVESVDLTGKTVWVADFSREELELVSASSAGR